MHNEQCRTCNNNFKEQLLFVKIVYWQKKELNLNNIIIFAKNVIKKLNLLFHLQNQNETYLTYLLFNLK